MLSAYPDHRHYVYILKKLPAVGELPRPFYVGIGQHDRVFAHEDEARDPNRTGAKVEAIRAIWSGGNEIVREIDSVHMQEPWDHEEGLIRTLNLALGQEQALTNSQLYSQSHKIDGVELRKYAANHIGSGDIDEIPSKFKLREKRLMAGPNKPKTDSSVFGKIYQTLKDNPGVTGEELVRLLSQLDFSSNKSAYTQSGRVSASWLVGYIEGGYFRSDRLHLQDFDGS